MIFELVTEVFDETLHRPGGGITEGADGMTFDLIGHVKQHVDLGRFGLAQRIGLLKALRDQGWGLVVAGSSVRYRARIRPFQRFELRTRLIGWDERFFYIEQAMWRGDTPCNHALLRTGVTEKGRLVGTERVADAMKLSPVSPDLPEWVAGWAEADSRRTWPPQV